MHSSGLADLPLHVEGDTSGITVAVPDAPQPPGRRTPEAGAARPTYLLFL